MYLLKRSNQPLNRKNILWLHGLKSSTWTFLHNLTNKSFKTGKNSHNLASDYLDTCIPGYLDTWTPGHLDTWIPGYLDTWIPQNLDTWILGYLYT